MKRIRNISLAWMIHIIALASISIYYSCGKENIPQNSGQPSIDYIRLTNPEVADSLITGGRLGLMIAIVGNNLGQAREVWFNDQKSIPVPTYVSNNSVLINIPTTPPGEITNKLRIVFADGSVLEYDFRVELDAPVLHAMENEYALAGETISLRGNFFYGPVKVFFRGDVEADVIEEEVDHLVIRVPEGAQKGPLKVRTPHGESESGFWYRDDRNILIDSDPKRGWWPDPNVPADVERVKVISTPGPDDPPSIAGNYLRITGTVAGWLSVVGGPAGAMGPLAERFPDDAILHPENYNFKFEVNTIKPYNAGIVKLNFGIQQPDFPKLAHYSVAEWRPPYDSKGKWHTITIPFEDMVESYRNAPAPGPVHLAVSPDGRYASRVVISGNPNDILDCDMAFDNFRIVPKGGGEGAPSVPQSTQDTWGENHNVNW